LRKTWNKTWKEIALGLVSLVAMLGVIVAAQPLSQAYPGVGSAVVAAIVCLVAYAAASKWIERRIPTELATRYALPELGAGFLGGCALFSTVMALLWLAAAYHPQGWGMVEDLSSGFALALLAGITEEILFRGLLFRLCARLLGTWGALLLTSTLFGFSHAVNPAATLGSSLAIALEAGVLLGAAYAASGRLWLPIGLHVGWNFTESSIFGMTLSGYNVGSGFIRGSLNGPNALTGGEFGPEASVVAVVVCVAAAAGLLWRTIKQRRVQPPIWRKAALEGDASAK
jgi:membrane protease YdiL (CAAX protease family)